MTFDPIVAYSRPEAERAGTHLVLMLHGYGSTEQDLLGMVPALPAEGFTYAAMRAPQQAGPGWQWFPLTLDATGGFTSDEPGLRQITEQIIGWIQERREHYAGVILLGFSQGMAVATSVVRRAPGIAAAVVGLSGFVQEPLTEELAGFFRDGQLTEAPRLPFFYGRDQQDPVIPEPMAAATLAWLREHTELTKVLYAGMGHSVCAQEVGHIGEFLRHVVRHGK